ncbi:MAG: hypothetical protein ACF8QF_06975 [Phycisphaerales bacterium]
MSFFQRLASMLGSRPHAVGVGVGTDTADRHDRLFDGDARRRPGVRGLLPGARAEQDATDQMRDAAEEILALVRKVDQHLDKQSARSLRMTEIAERMPRAADTLPEIRDQQERMTESLEDIATSARDMTDQLRFAMSQVAAIADRVERSAPHQERLGNTLTSLHVAVASMSGVIDRDRVRQARREERAALRSERAMRRLTITLACCAGGLFCCAGAIATLIVLG